MEPEKNEIEEDHNFYRENEIIDNCFESDCKIVMMIQCGMWYVLFQLYICLSVATVNTMGRYPCMGSLSICFHRCEHGSTRVIKQV